MGRTFVTDEVNNDYVVDVLPSGHMKAVDGGIEVVRIRASAAVGDTVNQWITASTRIKDIIITDCPASTWLYIADIAASSSASAAGIWPESTATGGGAGAGMVSGQWMMKIAMFSAGTFPLTIPLNILLTAGLVSMVTGNNNANVYARILSTAG